MKGISAMHCGAGAPLQEARKQVAEFDRRHAHGEHFFRWTGRMDGRRRILGCMFCALRTVERAA